MDRADTMRLSLLILVCMRRNISLVAEVSPEMVILAYSSTVLTHSMTPENG